MSSIESDDRATLTAGAVLQGRYRIERRLGQGGMGAVYEALDLRLDATVAIKEAFSANPSLRKQFEQEARLLARLHHPALPRVTDYFAESGRLFLVMQFIAGDDLGEIISQQPGPLPRGQVIAWADQLLDALIYLHTRDRQIVHRDIKPHNLKLTANGRIALLDFGLAKAESDNSATVTSASVFGFTRRYSPPEQMQDQGTCPRSDIYALGATLYHLVTGVKPPDAMVRSRAAVNAEADPLTPANEIYPAVGPEIAAILLKAMALDPAQRFKDANEFRESLRKLGRNDARSINNWSEGFTDEPASKPNINMTVVSKPVALDPFDSYSILKPAEADWLVSKPSRRPFVIAALFGLLLIGGVYAFSGSNDWADLSKAASHSTQAGISKQRSSASPGKPNIPGAVVGSVDRGTGKRRRTRQTERTRN